jgi:GT2 family glycosyltransferase
MKPIPVLGIPHFNRPDLLARCIESIDYPVHKLVIIQNGPKPKMIQLQGNKILGVDPSYIDEDGGPPEYIKLGQYNKKLISNIKRVTHPNAGVAGAWNEIIKLYPAPWWLISNNDIRFAPGDLEKMVKWWDEYPTAQMIYGNHGASWFGIKAEAVAQAGLFDENIYPAYLEDCDMSYRFDRLGLARMTVADVKSVHGDEKFSGSATIMSDPLIHQKNQITHGANFDYYRRKWGGPNERETFKTPFNDPNWPLWAWKFEPETRAKNQW